MAASIPEESINLDPVLPHLESLLKKREYPKTFCPSEVARAASISELQEAGAPSWRELMQPLRRLCFQMRDEGKLEILQRGELLPDAQSMNDTKGPIRIRRRT